MFAKKYLFRMAMKKLIRVHTLQFFLNRFKVHYGEENDSDSECDGEIIILVPRKSEDIQSKESEESMELTFCCCEFCHCNSCLCHCLTKGCCSFSSCLCNEFPQHSTINQFFTPKMFSVYHQEGRRACEEAKADEFLKSVCSANDVRDREPKRPAIPPPVGAGICKDNEIPSSDIKRKVQDQDFRFPRRCDLYKV